MAKFTYFYSVMNAGKSLSLLQVNHNYKTKNLKTLLIKPDIENRFGENKIGSRLGVSEEAISINSKSNILNIINEYDEDISAILVDEGQFLSKEQVIQLSDIVDYKDIDVLVYGLKTNIKGELFQGSESLLVYADKIIEIKQLCSLCQNKATMHLKFKDGTLDFDTEIDIGKEEKYISVCRKHYKEYLENYYGNRNE